MTSERRVLANAIRALAMDAVQEANSGHPGMPMGMADLAEVLWRDYLKHNPANPHWADRDRVVVSNGHGSMLLYAVLHLTGYALPMDEIRRFRQLHSKTPGHPEYGYAPGVETTTGPLGQGIANAIGMAIAERAMATQFNRPDHRIVDHHTYVLLGDGCLMEGISHEVCSLAGTLGLGKLIAIYDDNGISIDGKVEGWFTDDTPARFAAYGWQVIADVDGHDPAAMGAAISKARSEATRPSIICCQTIIGWGSPNKQGTAGAHGAALGVDEVALTREALDWPHSPFEIPSEIYAGWDARSTGAASEAAWDERFAAYREAYPELADEFSRRMAGDLPSDWVTHADGVVRHLVEAEQVMATRKASLACLNAFGPVLPELIGGSADLAGSNLTIWSDSQTQSAACQGGNYIYYGVREFGMSAINSGIALHGGFIPYASTFLMFSEYARNALRMAALMKIRSVFVFTHDSIGLGEDGPTHQAVEQTATLRMIPNMSVWRPCDTVESAVAWRFAIERSTGPSCLLFTRQNVAHQQRNAEQVSDIMRGGYVLRDCPVEPEAVLIATGSEVQLALDAAAVLSDMNRKVRVVSMPSCDQFDAQPLEYQRSVLPASVVRVAVEAGVSDGWRKYVGLEGAVLGIDTFGESAPAGDLLRHFGFTVENLVSVVEGVVPSQSKVATAV